MSTRGPSKISGRFHSTKGFVREKFGRTFGLSGAEARGKIERTRGDTEYNAARAKGYANATGDRVRGETNRVVGAVTGNSGREMGGNLRSGKGAFGQAVHRY